MSNNIRNLQELLKQHIGPNKNVIDIKIGPLTAPGENYSSILYKIDVVLKSKGGIEEKLHAVAKLVPALEKARIMCDIQVSVKKEIAMFNTIMPLLQDLQRQYGVKNIADYLPKLYGWRLNLDGKNDIVDEDSVILMENLKESDYQLTFINTRYSPKEKVLKLIILFPRVEILEGRQSLLQLLQGYVNVDRFVGLDLETTKSVLTELAAFHALPIALKLKKPEVFERKIRPLLTPHKPPHSINKEKSQKGSPDIIILEALEEDPKCLPYISKVKELLESTIGIFNHTTPNEPFATISHGDLWINNVMVKFHDKKPVSSKIIDFQFYDYKSPARDLVFLLFTSVQKKVLEESFDSLVKFYHSQFISRLKELDCDIQLFGLDQFLEEFRESVNLELKHSLIFALIVVMKKQGISPGFYPGRPMDIDKMRKEISLDAKEKARFMIHLCGTKGLI